MKRADALSLSKSRRGSLLAVALVLYGTFLVGSAPASMLGWVLAAATNSAISLERPQGAIWNGNADALALVGRADRPYRCKGLRWQLLFSRLFSGEVVAQVQFEDPNCGGRGTVAVHRHGVRFRDVELQFPVTMLAGQVPALVLGKLSGTVTLRTANAVWGSNGIAGEATITWSEAASALSHVYPLGDYVARGTAAGKRVEFQVETARGPLRIEGQGAWSSEAGLSFEGSARAIPGHGADLTELLKLAGPDPGNGMHQLKLVGYR